MATARATPYIVLMTGAPGVEETTGLHKVAAGLGDARKCGFQSEELREQGIRRGSQTVGCPHRWLTGLSWWKAFRIGTPCENGSS